MDHICVHVHICTLSNVQTGSTKLHLSLTYKSLHVVLMAFVIVQIETPQILRYKNSLVF